MKKKHSIPTCIIFYMLCMSGLNAQETVSASGGNASGNGGEAYYTVGQVSYNSYEGSNGSISQGVQQVYEISVIANFIQIEGADFNFSVYPNPTTDFIIINAEDCNVKGLKYCLYNNVGKELQSEKLIENETRIDMSRHEEATYVITLFQDDKLIKSYQVIKK